ncbi:MAG TPA: T9SS type A sorting domain-containing protein [Parafilimonas sp.]|nr:T9SS type A sorting domain-containing protein [Parafilimonas sp.]
MHNNFSVYPVPAKYLLHVITNGKAVVTLTDLSGKILLTNAINGSGTINVAGLAPSVYYLKNNATGSSQKVIVIK